MHWAMPTWMCFTRARRGEHARDPIAQLAFLKAKPSIAIFLPVTLLNMREIMVCAKRVFCQSFMVTTLAQ